MYYWAQNGKDRVKCEYSITTHIRHLIKYGEPGAHIDEDDKVIVQLMERNTKTGAVMIMMLIPLDPVVAAFLPNGSRIIFTEGTFEVLRLDHKIINGATVYADEIEAELDKEEPSGFDSEASVRKADTAVTLASVVIVVVVVLILAKIIWG